MLACLEIKIPIRVKLDESTKCYDFIKEARIDAISPPYEHKLAEKLGRFYFNVALEDNFEIFKIADSSNPQKDHDQWIESSMRALFSIVKDNKFPRISKHKTSDGCSLEHE